MTDHPVDDTLAAFALDALEPDEAAFVARHLAHCGRCRAEVDALREATAALAESVPDAIPPAGMRERVLARALAGHRPARAPASWARLALAASALLVLGLGYLFQGERRESQELALRLALADSLLASRDSLLERLLGVDVEIATLAATDVAPAIRLYWVRDRGELIVAAQRLPPAATGRTYQLWGIGSDGRPVGLGTFNTGPDGRAVVTLAVTGEARYTVGAVTDEPAGGSPQPTTTPFLVGPWPGTSD